MAANCALAAAQPQAALDRARAAYRLFQSQQSAWGQAHAGLALAQAHYAAGPVSAQLLRAASQAAVRLEALGSAEATQAHLLGGRVALDLGRRDEADRHLSTAAQSRRRGPEMARASGWLCEALRAEAAADPRRLLAACAAGWRSWMSFSSLWAPRNCGRRPQPTGPNWLSSRSVMLRGFTGPGSC